jgi:hypothetical protein
VRDIAIASGITERATISVLHDLRGAGIIWTHREGRRNVNQIDLTALEKHHPWGASAMAIPEGLIQATVAGLSGLAAPGALYRHRSSKSA